jgi:hypothetical protein
MHSKAGGVNSCFEKQMLHALRIFVAGQNIRPDLRLSLCALRAAVVEALGDVVYEPFSSS